MSSLEAHTSIQIEHSRSLLMQIARDRRHDFSGTGLVFYSNLHGLPHLQLTNGDSQENINLPSYEVVTIISKISTIHNPFHDGFHFINIHSWNVTHLSQFISPPIPQDAAQRFHGTGSRLMAAVLASILPGIMCTGIVSQEGHVRLYHEGIEIEEEY